MFHRPMECLPQSPPVRAAPGPERGTSARAARVRDAMTRMRTRPRLYDYCCFSARCNLEVLRDFARRLSLGRDGRELTVLDVGCGAKPFRGLFPPSCRYVGVDASASSAADLRHDLNHPFPLADASADGVLLSEILEHLRDPAHVLDEVCRVLRPGGWLFVSTPFCFPVHGRPHDFYRFTEYFYRTLAERWPLALERLEATNTALTTPLLLVGQIVLAAPGPFLAKQAVWLATNLAVGAVEGLLAGPSRGSGRLAAFLRSNPVGYAALFRAGRREGDPPIRAESARAPLPLQASRASLR